MRASIVDSLPVVEGAPLIERVFAGAQGFAIGKMGSVEAAAARHYLRRERSSAKGEIKSAYPDYIFERCSSVRPCFLQTKQLWQSAQANGVETCV